MNVINLNNYQKKLQQKFKDNKEEELKAKLISWWVDAFYLGNFKIQEKIIEEICERFPYLRLSDVEKKWKYYISYRKTISGFDIGKEDVEYLKIEFMSFKDQFRKKFIDVDEIAEIINNGQFSNT